MRDRDYKKDKYSGKALLLNFGFMILINSVPFLQIQDHKNEEAIRHKRAETENIVKRTNIQEIGVSM